MANFGPLTTGHWPDFEAFSLRRVCMCFTFVYTGESFRMESVIDAAVRISLYS